MSDTAEIKFGNWLPDMYLYHSDEIHYDLLVSESSRIAQGFDYGISDLGQWKKAKGRKRTSTTEKEKPLIEDELMNDDKTIDEATDEVILMRAKNSGHRRTAP